MCAQMDDKLSDIEPGYTLDMPPAHIIETTGIHQHNNPADIKGAASGSIGDAEPIEDEDDEPGGYLPELTLDVLLALSAHERIPYIKAMRVYYKEWDTIWEAIRSCHEENDGIGEPECMMIVGFSGAGKSTIATSYRDEFPPKYIEENGKSRWIRRVLYVVAPAPAGIKDMATEILFMLGDPRAHSGTRGNMTLRIRKGLRDCGVEILIVDDLQHYLDRSKTGKIMYTATDWFKNLIKDTGVACVFIGLPESEQVIKANPQLGRLFGDPYVLSCFEWRWDDPQTIAKFQKLIADIEALLPLRRKEEFSLNTVEMAWRCYVASGGLMAYLMKLIRGAAIAALRNGDECLSMPLLAAAFTNKVAGRRRGIRNPFIGPPPEQNENKPLTGM